MATGDAPPPNPTPHFLNVWMLGPLFILLGGVLIVVLYWLIDRYCAKPKVRDIPHMLWRTLSTGSGPHITVSMRSRQ